MDYQEFFKTLRLDLPVESVDEIKFDFLISEVASGKLKFLSVVEALEEILTNENVALREKGVILLSRIVDRVPPSLFISSEISAIAHFFCNCLKDHHSLLPMTLKALRAIVNMNHTSEEDICKVLKSLFQNVNCTSQLWSDRITIYNILNSVIVCHIEKIKHMNSEFIQGLLLFIEGETDPKCLLLIFKFLPPVIKEFHLGPLSEELFELLACYFPIDFNVAVKDDTVITREDLSDGLLSCLTAKEEYCEQCLPLIQEKLNSNFKVAKLDSYKLLELCCNDIDNSFLENYLKNFWESILKDTMPGNDKEICEAGLSVLKNIIQSLFMKSSEKQNPKNLFLDDVITSMNSIISNINDAMFQPGMKVLAAVSDACEQATFKVLKFLTQMFSSFDLKSAVQLKIILPCLLPILLSCSKHKIEQRSTECQLLYKQLIDIYLSSCRFDNGYVRKLAFSGIIHIVPVFSEDLKKIVFQVIIENIKTKDDIKSSEEFQEVLRKVGKYHGKPFYAALISETKFSVKEVASYTSKLLLAFSYLANLPFYSPIVVPIYLEYVLNSSFHHLGLENLLYACRFSKKTGSTEFYRYIEEKHNVSESLLLWWKNSANDDESKLLNILCEILALITRNQNLCKQQDMVNKMILSGMHNENKKDKVFILESVLGSVLPEVEIPGILKLMNQLAEWALVSGESEIRLSSCRLLSSLVNKASDVLALEMLNYIFRFISKELEMSSESSLRFSCGCLFTWIIKAIIIRESPSYEENVTKWFDYLGREDIGSVLAEQFQTVLEDDELYLNWESHCNIRILYRQKLFEYFPKLLNKYKLSQTSVKHHYLIALCKMLNGLPLHIVQTNISDVIVVLVDCFASEEPSTLPMALEILLGLLEKQEKLLSDYVRVFMPKLLGFASSHGSMNVRINTLRCIFFYCFYPTYTLLPLKNMVIKSLEYCLDDKKRLVRKEAVRARCRWFLVGAPGEDLIK